MVEAYPLVLAGLLAAYGLLLRHRPSLAFAAGAVACWLAVIGWYSYWALRQVVTGLDYLAGSLVVFAVAILVSLAKSGILARRVAAREREGPPPPG
jgi:hypothetical protein